MEGHVLLNSVESSKNFIGDEKTYVEYSGLKPNVSLRNSHKTYVE